MSTEAFNKHGETIWAYLHGELDEDARLSFEQELADSPELCGRFETARRLDRMIRTVLPAQSAAEESDEEIEEQALNAWERDQGTSHPQPSSSRRGGLPSWFGFSLRATAGIASLAAALYVLVSPALRYSPVPRWATPVFVPLALRGAETRDESSAVSPYAAERCQVALCAALGQVLKARSVILPAGLRFSLSVHELRQGAVAVAVQARTSDARLVGDWTGDYSDVDAFLSQADVSAVQMVDLLLDKVGTRAKRVAP